MSERPQAAHGQSQGMFRVLVTGLPVCIAIKEHIATGDQKE